MFKQLGFTAVLATLALSPWVMAEESVDQVIASHLEARGGLDKLNAINSARLSGDMSMGGGHGGHGGGMTVPIVAEYQPAQNRLRFEYVIQGKTAVRAFDGKTGWTVQPFLSKTEPERMAEDDLQKIRRQADFLGALVNHQEKGHRIELEGTEDVEGTEAFKLKVTRENGDISYYFLDTDYYLPFQVISSTVIQGRKVKTVTTLGDYKEVDGVLFAHSVAVSFPGGSQTVTYNKIELNVELADDRFTMPTRTSANTAG